MIINTSRRLWWLWIPLAAMVVQIVIEIVVPAPIYTRLLSENGPHELLQFFVLAIAFVLSLQLLARKEVRSDHFLFIWFVVAALGCLYTAGEEISWGQQFLKWTTPEFWRTVNDQQETNLHNTSSWLDQKPRLLLEIGVMAGGLLIPALRKFWPEKIPGWLAQIAPPAYLAVTAGLCLFVKLADTLGEGIGIAFFKRGSEVQELYMFYFVMLYLHYMKKRSDF